MNITENLYQFSLWLRMCVKHILGNFLVDNTTLLGFLRRVGNSLKDITILSKVRSNANIERRNSCNAFWHVSPSVYTKAVFPVTLNGAAFKTTL